MFGKVRRVRSVVHFVRDRVPHYGPLITDDLHHFRDELVRATVGAGISAVAGLIFACFLSLAVIVTAWDSHYRITAAWLVCLAWAILAAVGLRYASKALSGPRPFRLLSAAVARDYGRLLAALDGEEKQQ